jgi:hypothetical protein
MDARYRPPSVATHAPAGAAEGAKRDAGQPAATSPRRSSIRTPQHTTPPGVNNTNRHGVRRKLAATHVSSAVWFMTNNTTHPPAPAGGFLITWILADTPRSITTRDGSEKTIIELRDPTRLAQSITVWLDGSAGVLADVQPGAAISLHVPMLRAGKARGELVASVDRAAVERAFGAGR